MLETGGSHNLDIFKLILLSSIIIVLILILAGAVSWLRILQIRRSALSDMDWKEEKKRLEKLAAEKILERDGKENTSEKGSKKES